MNTVNAKRDKVAQFACNFGLIVLESKRWSGNPRGSRKKNWLNPVISKRKGRNLMKAHDYEESFIFIFLRLR